MKKAFVLELVNHTNLPFWLLPATLMSTQQRIGIEDCLWSCFYHNFFSEPNYNNVRIIVGLVLDSLFKSICSYEKKTACRLSLRCACRQRQKDDKVHKGHVFKIFILPRRGLHIPSTLYPLLLARCASTASASTIPSFRYIESPFVGRNRALSP